MSRETQEKFSSYRHFTVDMGRYVQEHSFGEKDSQKLQEAPHPNSFIGSLAEALVVPGGGHKDHGEMEGHLAYLKQGILANESSVNLKTQFTKDASRFVRIEVQLDGRKVDVWSPAPNDNPSDTQAAEYVRNFFNSPALKELPDHDKAYIFHYMLQQNGKGSVMVGAFVPKGVIVMAMQPVQSLDNPGSSRRPDEFVFEIESQGAEKRLKSISSTSYHSLGMPESNTVDARVTIKFDIPDRFDPKPLGEEMYQGSYFGKLQPKNYTVEVEVLNEERAIAISESQKAYLIDKDKEVVADTKNVDSLDFGQYLENLNSPPPPTLWERVQGFYLRVSEWFSRLVEPEVSMISGFAETIGDLISGVASSVLSFLGVKTHQTAREEESLERDSVVGQQQVLEEENSVVQHQHQEAQRPSQEQNPASFAGKVKEDRQRSSQDSPHIGG